MSPDNFRGAGKLREYVVQRGLAEIGLPVKIGRKPLVIIDRQTNKIEPGNFLANLGGIANAIVGYANLCARGMEKYTGGLAEEIQNLWQSPDVQEKLEQVIASIPSEERRSFGSNNPFSRINDEIDNKVPPGSHAANKIHRGIGRHSDDLS